MNKKGSSLHCPTPAMSIRFALRLGLFVFLAAPTPAATVVPVKDGDTIRERSGGRLLSIRMPCIDAPEMAQTPHSAMARDPNRPLPFLNDQELATVIQGRREIR